MTRPFLCVFAISLLAAAKVHAQPANNQFTDAWDLVGTSVSTNGNSSQPANATKETGEPNHGGLVGGRSVWFRWTAPVSGPTRVTTQGSGFNTLLGVYTGTAVSALNVIASNDNAPGGGNFSRVDFNADQGTTYQIAVDGRNGSGNGAASGAYVLLVQMQGTVAISTPLNGSAFAVGAPIAFVADASTPNPPITRMDFYRGGILFASADSAPYSVMCYDAPPGTNAFRAIASDGAGLTWTSAVVNVAALNVGLTMVSPTQGATFLNTNPVAVSVVDFLLSGQITNVEFFVDGQKFSDTNARPFNTLWREVTPGLHQLTAIGTDNSGNFHTSAPVAIAVARMLVRSNSIWKYLDDGSDQGAAWAAPGFHDGSWTNGPAQLGYGDGDEATVVSYGPNASAKFTTTYFRHSFKITNAASYTNLMLRVLRDDGAVVHLNGVEAARYNMPTGAITYTTFAAGTTGDETTFFPTNAPASLVVEGTNVLAVEIHQSDLTSSDVSFDLELLAVPAVPRNQPPLVSLISPTNGEMFLGPTPLLLEATATDADGSVTIVEFFVNGVKFGEATNSPFSFTWGNPPLGAHVLRAIATDNEGASAGSAVVSVTVFDALGTPLPRVTSPAHGAIIQGPTNLTVHATVLAPNAVTNIVFIANGSAIGEDGAPPFSVVWSNAPFGTSTLAVVAFDANGLAATSAVVSVVINPPPDNTDAPILFAINPAPGVSASNLTSIQVTFSEPVVGVNAADLLVNGVVATSVSGSGSNYIFTFPQPPVGAVTVSWTTNHGIADVGVPSLPFDETAPDATWSYTRLDAVAPTILAKAPGANAIVTNLTQVSVQFSEPVSGVDAADFLVNGAPAIALASSTNTIYAFSFPQPYSGLIDISWAADHGIADLATTPNAFNANGAGATWSYTLDARTILVQSNANWLFIKGTNEASTPIDAWRQPTFNDSIWSNAPAPFFYGDPYASASIPGTELIDMQGNYTSIYLRKRFNVPNRTAVTNLFLNAQSDDGFIAWINGVEVLRYNLPAGDVPFDGVTLTSITEPNSRGAAYLGYTLPDPAGFLVEGENVLVVHAFNQSLTPSSDFGFNAQLYTYLADASASAPLVFAAAPASGEVFSLTNITITFTEPVNGVDTTDLLVNGVPATEMTSTTSNIYSFSFAQPSFGSVVVT
ncbi:MAG TPA: Ig-like domain-containing protein, partial [Candidatus Limnocylindria bacterium]|nr:Ig-like domain-containing protein [Candidatus Limnocylindria bacterium]